VKWPAHPLHRHRHRRPSPHIATTHISHLVPPLCLTALQLRCNCVATALQLRAGYGYDESDYQYLHSMRGLGDVVELGGVGGAMLFVHADVHRMGINFPAFVSDHKGVLLGLLFLCVN
jgi:hypothetical protein